MLVGFIDFDWVNNPNALKSMAGYAFNLGSYYQAKSHLQIFRN